MNEMNFGTKFINIVKTLYRPPKAQIATNEVLSRPIEQEGHEAGVPTIPITVRSGNRTTSGGHSFKPKYCWDSNWKNRTQAVTLC